MTSETMRSALRVTGALSDLQRVRIMGMLQRGELCVCQIVEVLGLAPSTVSKHLSILHAANLVDSRKDGRWAYYRLMDRPPGALARPVVKWLAQVLRNDDTFRQDAKALKRVTALDRDNLCRQQRNR